MSRSGYVEDYEHVALYRAALDRAIRGRRGQAFLREMAAALDAMPVRELVCGDIVRDDGQVCAIGAVAVARRLDVSELDVDDGEEVGRAFGVAQSLAREVAFMNDEYGSFGETPDERWSRMRAWVASQLRIAAPKDR